MKISILMSVYYRDTPSFLDNALNSILNQSVLPDEIVLVEDGPIPNNLSSIIDSYRSLLAIKSIKLPHNLGLASALNFGLAQCSFPLIARFDSDDINLPNRLELQRNIHLKNPSLDVVGSHIKLFANGFTKIVKFPTIHNRMFEYFRFRDPLAHPAVMFKKSFFDKAGVYNVKLRKDQDTMLWANGFMRGAVFGNVDAVLLLHRVDCNLMSRRHNFQRVFDYIKLRLKINRMLKYGFLSYIWLLLYLIYSFIPANFGLVLYRFLK